MTVWIKFSGWFQCRLATAPDPTDELRGVSGYAHALPNEPDFERIIRLQPDFAIQRSYCQPIGVKVTHIWINGIQVDDHPLLGGLVDFLDNPKFEGRNDILTDEGEEAIVPINIQIKKDCCLIQRKFDDNMNNPPSDEDDFKKFNQLKASGIHTHPGTIGETTGIFDLGLVWQDRISKLHEDLRTTTNEIEESTLKARIKFLSEKATSGLASRFVARMLYSVSLTGNIAFQDPHGYLPGKPAFNRDKNKPEEWSLEFWCGGWDADALTGYIEGYLRIPLDADTSNKNLVNQDINEMIKEPTKSRL
jgi:hypothetical protein